MMSKNGGWVGVGQNGHRGRTTIHHMGPQNLHAGNEIEKRLHRLLQAIQHAEVIERTKQSGRFPVGMYRQVNKLTHFIKPSSPHPDTTARVQQNTDEWMNCNLRILKDHYDCVIAEGLQDLPQFPRVALDKAVAYGRARYKHCLTNATIATLTSLVEDCITSPSLNPGGAGSLDEAEWPLLQSGPI